MLRTLVSALELLGTLSDPLAWVVLGAFVIGSVGYRYDRALATRFLVGTWVLFALFWFSLIHHFVFVQKSIVEGLGSIIAVPAALYVAYLLLRGRESLVVLSRAVAIMGLVYFPFIALDALRQPLVETVAGQTHFLLSILGVDPVFTDAMALEGQPLLDKQHPYKSTFVFRPDGHTVSYTVLLACSGIGSIAIFAGLIAAVRAPLDRKLRALAVSLPIIYLLNLFRNVFIAVTFGRQYLHVFPDLVMGLFATDDPYAVSYYVADRIIAQSLSVVALVGITYLVVRELPEVLEIIDDLLFMVTGEEYDLRDALDIAPVRADGDGRSE